MHSRNSDSIPTVPVAIHLDGEWTDTPIRRANADRLPSPSVSTRCRTACEKSRGVAARDGCLATASPAAQRSAQTRAVQIRRDGRGTRYPARWEGHPVRFRPCRGQVRAALRAPSHHRVVRQPGLDHAAAWVVHRQCACMNRAARDRRQTPRQRIPAFPVPGPYLPVAMRAPPADIRGKPAWRQDSPPRQGRQPGEVVPRRRFAEEGARLPMHHEKLARKTPVNDN